MCDDHADVWNEVWRDARKDHKCLECCRRIAPGERYLEIRSLFDGSWETSRWCNICHAHWQYYRRFNEGCVVLSGLRDYEVEFAVDAQDDFVLFDGSVAECLKERAGLA